ncbi:hypothetical protein LCGC14_2788930, partial [marine sediment metagenome]
IVYYRVPGKKSKKREYFGRGLEGQRKACRRDTELAGQKKKPGRREPTPTFSELTKAYLVAKEGSVTESTMNSMLYKIHNVICPEIGHTAVGGLTPSRIDRFVNKRLKTVKKTTVHRDLSVIQAILRWAVKRQYIAKNPIEQCEMPKRDDLNIQPATVAEIKSLLKHSPEHLKRVLTICTYTGARPGPVEVFSLQYENVNWHDKTITILSADRGGLKQREIPLHPNFLKQLKAWHKADRNNGYIIRYNGEKIRSIKTAYKHAKEKAGITRKLPLYSLRHFFVTAILKRGGDLKTTSNMAGHTRTSTTTTHYQMTDTDMARAAIGKLPAL